jgi:hypothetical protein
MGGADVVTAQVPYCRSLVQHKAVTGCRAPAQLGIVAHTTKHRCNRPWFWRPCYMQVGVVSVLPSQADDWSTNPRVYVYWACSENATHPASMRLSHFQHVENRGGRSSRGDFSSETVIWIDSDGFPLVRSRAKLIWPSPRFDPHPHHLPHIHIIIHISTLAHPPTHNIIRA